MPKTKNVKLTLKDLFKGQIIYVAHPFYGISTYKIVDTTVRYLTSVDSPFIKANHIFDGEELKSTDNNLSTIDCGLDLEGREDSYNGRRTFRKLKQAKSWMEKWSKDKKFIQRHERHEQYFQDYDDEYLLDEEYLENV